MNPSLVSPAWFALTAWLIIVLTIGVIAVHTLNFASALRHAGLAAASTAPYLMAGALAAWAAWAIVQTGSPLVLPEPAATGAPPLLLLKVLPLCAAAVILMF